MYILKLICKCHKKVLKWQALTSVRVCKRSRPLGWVSAWYAKCMSLSSSSAAAAGVVNSARVVGERDVVGAAGPALTRGGRSRDAAATLAEASRRDASFQRHSTRSPARTAHCTRLYSILLCSSTASVANLSTVYCPERPTHVWTLRRARFGV